ncbi:MAG: SAM-dependent chlorinase/fluorinase [Vicinamibacteraceae bacterium]|nr:SAM-dependent chlorinase/fluorinase [Vicinamibacteraceae bacterium]
MPIITLMTDFGTADGYVAEMKGVILSNIPETTLVDVTHTIAAHDVVAARVALARYWPRFPQGTVHIVVVDPGVGTPREALIVEWERHFFVGPDNGVLTDALDQPGATAWAIRVDRQASPTFHGRDVFAPAAAALVIGTPPSQLGRPLADPVRLPLPQPRPVETGTVEGEIIAVDHFGNCVTNIRPAVPAGTLECAGRRLRVCRTYGDAAEGEAIGVVGSVGLLEIAVRNARADARLGLARAMPVRYTAPEAGDAG